MALSDQIRIFIVVILLSRILVISNSICRVGNYLVREDVTPKVALGSQNNFLTKTKTRQSLCYEPTIDSMTIRIFRMTTDSPGCGKTVQVAENCPGGGNLSRLRKILVTKSRKLI